MRFYVALVKNSLCSASLRRPYAVKPCFLARKSIELNVLNCF